MDGARFDLFARALGTPRTRRTALLLLGGVAAGPVLGSGDAGAKRKKKRKKPCKAPMKRCGGKCVAIQTDASNCGACGNRCGSGVCLAGQCPPPPVCLSNGVTFRQGEGQCCSENVSCQVGTTFIECTCLPGEAGNPCLAPGDCESGNCIGYQCA